MEHNSNIPKSNDTVEYKVSVTRCPSCNSLTVEGSDTDGQIFCAKCGLSFLPKSCFELTNEEFKRMTEQATAKYTRSGWYAYEIDKIE